MSADAQTAAPLTDTSRRAPTWPRAAAVVVLLAITLVVAKSCQQSQIDVTQEEALTLATEQISFQPEDTQIRLLRQGIDRHPFWIVSLSTPEPEGEGFAELAVVRIDAGTGEIVEFREQQDPPRGRDEAP